MRCAEASVPRPHFQQFVVESLTFKIDAGGVAQTLFELETESIPLLPFRRAVPCRLAQVGPKRIDSRLKLGPRPGGSFEHLRAYGELRLELLSRGLPGGGFVGTTVAETLQIGLRGLESTLEIRSRRDRFRD